MASLLELSHELLHCILSEIEPADLAAISQTCQDLYNYVEGNELLHKELYIGRYDEPRTQSHLNWESDLRNLVKLEKILETENRESKSQYIQFVSQQINKMLSTAAQDYDKSLNLEVLSDYFKDTNNIDAFLCASSLFDRAGGDDTKAAPTPELRQAAAKLHCLFGVPVDSIPGRSTFKIDRPDRSLSPSSCTRSHSRSRLTHPYARSKVYDLRQYSDGSLWGPFMDDGQQRVDWEKVEAVMIVLGYNLNRVTERSEGLFPDVWDTAFLGAVPNSFISPPVENRIDKDEEEQVVKIRELALALDAQDPYGISGTWMRVVCFLDYNDLYEFNFGDAVPDNKPRPGIDIQEGEIELEETLQVTRIEPPGTVDEDDDDAEEQLDWSNFKGERLPVVHFTGNSRSLHASWDPNPNSRIRGTVRQTPEGEIRWTTYSIFHGEEKWRSEGIQVGGIRSARGVLGNWFDKDYDMHGPAGPTAFWKVTNELAEDKAMAAPFAIF